MNGVLGCLFGSRVCSEAVHTSMQSLCFTNSAPSNSPVSVAGGCLRS